MLHSERHRLCYVVGGGGLPKDGETVLCHPDEGKKSKISTNAGQQSASKTQTDIEATLTRTGWIEDGTWLST